MQECSNATLKKCAPFFKSDSQSQHVLVSHNSRQKSDQRQLLYEKMAGENSQKLWREVDNYCPVEVKVWREVVLLSC